ncbi:MAG: hypothetical protein GY730_05850 [bacterium]|nr:hypothetical protein [bacterium]
MLKKILKKIHTLLFSFYRQKGFAIATSTTLAVVVVGVTTIAVFIAINQHGRVELLKKSDRSKELADLGMFLAKNHIAGDSDWSDDGGILYNNTAYEGGYYTVTLSEESTHNIKITSVGIYNDNKHTVVKNISRTMNKNNQLPSSMYISISTANTFIIDNSLIDLQLSNNHPTRDITISEMIITWTTDNGELINRIQTGEASSWLSGGAGSPDGEQPSGTLFDIVDYVLTAQSTGTNVSLRFNSSITSREFSIYFRFADGTSKHVEFSPAANSTQSSIIYIDDSSTHFHYYGHHIQDTLIVNTSPTQNALVTGFKIKWLYDDTTMQFKRLRFITDSGNGIPTSVWSGYVDSDTFLNITPYALPANETHEITFTFDVDDMNYKRYVFTLYFADGSEKTATIDNNLINQADYLDVSVSDAELSFGDKTLEGIVLKNTHTETGIWLDKIKINLDPDSSQLIEGIVCDGQEVFSGTGTLNAVLDLTNVSFNAGVTISNRIDFDSSVDGVTFNITYIMLDSTEKSVDFNLSNQPFLNSFFSAVTRDAVIFNSHSPTRVQNLTISNTGAYNCIITHIRPVWKAHCGEKLTKIAIGASTTWSGNAGSGTKIDINDYSLTAGATNIPCKFTFNKKMVSPYKAAPDFDFEYTFIDSTTSTVSIKMNPASWVAGDNFESGNYSGGSGFVNNWLRNGFTTVKKTDGHSGSYFLIVQGKNTIIKRQVDLAGYSTMKMRFFRRVVSFEASHNDRLYFEVSDNGGTDWHTIATYTESDETSKFVYEEHDLSDYTLGSDFFIRFRNTSNQKGDRVLFDDIFFFE